MALAGAIFLVVGFVALVKAFGLLGKCGEVLDLARTSLAVLRNPSLDDDAKESALQSYAAKLFLLFLLLTAGAALALVLPAGLIWVLDLLHVVSLRAVLEMEGHRVAAAVDGVDAVELGAAFRPTIAFVDIALPGLDGYEVARRLRARDGGNTMVLVAVTGRGQPEDRWRAEDMGERRVGRLPACLGKGARRRNRHRRHVRASRQDVHVMFS